MQEIISVPEFIWICSYQNSTKTKLFDANHHEENMLFNVFLCPNIVIKTPQQLSKRIVKNN